MNYKINSKKKKVTIEADNIFEYNMVVRRIMEYEGYISPDFSLSVPKELEMICVKAIAKNTNQWISGLISGVCGTMSINGIEIEPGSICRYSGAKDISGNKIYEYDILLFSDCGDCGVVKFDEESGMWSADIGEYCEAFCDFDFSTVKVIGNILGNEEDDDE